MTNGMQTTPDLAAKDAYRLLFLIVNRGKGDRIAEYGQRLGLKQPVSFLGRGTAANSVLRFLEMDDIRKEIILFVLPAGQEQQVLSYFNDKFHFDRPNQGVAFTVALSHLAGSAAGQQVTLLPEAGSRSALSALWVIVDKDRGEEVLRTAEELGCTGATIMEAHGSTDQSRKVFDVLIEREKEAVLILAPTAGLEDLSSGLTRRLQLEEKNSGVLFSFPLAASLGLNGLEEAAAPQEEQPAEQFAIWTFVRSDKDEAVIRAAEKAGSAGGTIFHARGTHPLEHPVLFKDIQPARELVLIIAAREEVDPICGAIKREVLEAEHFGLLFAFPIRDTAGFYRHKKQTAKTNRMG